jgi:translation initiation factor 2B subunit (eIF-2B alpha/beta/delta family)
MDGPQVLVAVLRNDGEVLVLRRAEGSDSGRWTAIAAHADDDLDRDALDRTLIDAIGERSGLDEAVTLVRTGDPIVLDDEGEEDGGSESFRVVRPFLFDAATRELTPESGIEYEWVPPTELRRRETAPGLWEAYERVAPTVETIATDRDRGSAALSVSALEVLRDRAGVLADRTRSDRDRRERSGAGNGDDDPWAELAGLARELRDVRPSMVAIGNRVNRAMATADERTPEALERAAQRTIERAASADGAAAAVAAERIGNATAAEGEDDSSRDTGDDPDSSGPLVLTLSRSGTVIAAIRELDPPPREILIAESRPGGEGRAVAEELAADYPVTLLADAGVAHALGGGGSGGGHSSDNSDSTGSVGGREERTVDAVLVGSDRIYPDGSVLNKVGTRGTAIAAAYEGVPVYVVAASAKIAPEAPEPDLEAGASEGLYAGAAAIEELNPTFDVTPDGLVAGVCTERGVLTSDEIETVADEFAALAAWEDEEDEEV